MSVFNQKDFSELDKKTQIILVLSDFTRKKKKCSKNDFIDFAITILPYSSLSNTKTMINYYLKKFADDKMIDIKVVKNEEMIYVRTLPSITSYLKLGKIVSAKLNLVLMVASLLIFFHAVWTAELLPFIYSLVFVAMTSSVYFSYVYSIIINPPKLAPSAEEMGNHTDNSVG